MLWQLALRDCRDRYLGSVLGFVWIFVQPVMTITVIFVAFSIGFRSQPVNNVPFYLWLACGMIPWFFLVEAMSGATSSVVGKEYLIKNCAFRASLLPLASIMSSLLVHLIFLVALLLIFAFSGSSFTLKILQLPFYTCAGILMLLGLSWLTSSLAVLVRDTIQVVVMAVQIGLWVTPIFWDCATLSKQWAFFFQLNPAYYIVQGYRDSFIGGKWFWEYETENLLFWTATLLLLFAGAVVFRRLRPHFADVL